MKITISDLQTVADAAQQTTKVIEVAKPIASSTAETIASADPVVIVGTGGALFLAYLLLPPVWSAISFNFRGFKGELVPLPLFVDKKVLQFCSNREQIEHIY